MLCCCSYLAQIILYELKIYNFLSFFFLSHKSNFIICIKQYRFQFQKEKYDKVN